MPRSNKISTLFGAVTLGALLGISSLPAKACTGIIFTAEDGTVVPSRTMEFSFDFHSDIIIVPAGTEITTLSSDKNNIGFTYKSKYGFVGSNAAQLPLIGDGLNEAGLYSGMFYFSGFAEFAETTEDNRSKAVSSEELSRYLLANFATVDEVRAGMEDIVVVGTVLDLIQGVAPFHYSVVDASGDAIVIEFTKAGMKIHENTVGVLTNSPNYEWHMTNLANYFGLRAKNYEPMMIGKHKVVPFGEGTGMLGLPGDLYSTTRFIRAVAFKHYAQPTKSAEDTIFKAFHVLNNFDIPRGIITSATNEDNADYTLWTSAADTRNLVYYYKTYNTQAVESIDLKKALAKVTKPTILKMESGFQVRDRTDDIN